MRRARRSASGRSRRSRRDRVETAAGDPSPPSRPRSSTRRWCSWRSPSCAAPARPPNPPSGQRRCGCDRRRALVSPVPADGRRQLAGNDQTGEPGKLRAADFHNRLGTPGTSCHVRAITEKGPAPFSTTGDNGVVHAPHRCLRLSRMGQAPLQLLHAERDGRALGFAVRSTRSKLSTSNARPIRFPARSSSMPSATS